MNAFLSFINGLIYTGLLFVLCLIFTVGAKWLFLAVKNKLSITKVEKTPPQETEEKPKPATPTKPAKKPQRTIEINADAVDKIYFKKSS